MTIPLFLTLFPYLVCLFCSNSFVNIMEMYPTAIPARYLASYPTRFNPTIFKYENVCTKSGNMTVFVHLFDMFMFVISPFDKEINCLLRHFSLCTIFLFILQTILLIKSLYYSLLKLQYMKNLSY